MYTVLSQMMCSQGYSCCRRPSMRQMMSTISGTTLRSRSSGQRSSASPMTVWFV